MTRPRVLLLSTHGDASGAPLHVLSLVTHLSSQIDYHCVFGGEGTVAAKVRALGVPVRVLTGLTSAISPLHDLRCVGALRTLLRDIRPQVVHAHSAKAGMVARIALADGEIGARCLYTVHGWGFGSGRPKVQSALLRFIESALAKRLPCRYIFVSDADRRQALAELGVRTIDGVVIRNGVEDHGRRAMPNGSTRVLMAARVAFQKHHDLLVRAFDASRIAGPLELAGLGTDGAAFGSRIDSLAPARSPEIERLGVRDDVPDLMAKAGAFALISRYEGLPLSIVEAMCAGLPIVASHVGGNAELVEDGVNGFLVEPGDVRTLTDRLDRLSDPALRREMGLASRRRYEESCSISAMIERTRSEYERLVQGTSNTARS